MITNELRQEIISQVGRGFTYTEVAEALAISRNSVAGVVFRHRRGPVKRIGTGKRVPINWQYRAIDRAI